MTHRFQVITSVPDMTDDRDAVGNLAACFELWEADFTGAQVKRVSPLTALSLRVPVFHVGEILIVVGGREICYPGRKADKWSVTYDEFERLDDAIARSAEIERGSTPTDI